MSLLIGFCILLTLAVISVLVFLMRKVVSNATLPVTAEWIEDLSLDKYRPMLKILDEGDIEFLQSQPGFTPGMAAKVRTQRTQIFRGYLKSLETDFARTCSAIKLVMTQSSHDRPELAEALLRQQITFAFSMVSVRARLLLYQWGICGVDASELVRLFDSMRVELRTLVPAASNMVA